MRNIIQQDGIYLINPFRSNEKLLKKSIESAFNENLTEYEMFQISYSELKKKYEALLEELACLREKNKVLTEKLTEQEHVMEVLSEQLKAKNI